MKILHVISTVNPRSGGVIEGVKQFVSQYESLGATAEIVCCDQPGMPWHNDIRLPLVHALGPAKLSYAYAPRLLTWLKDNVSRFDAVIVDGIWQYHSLATWWAISKSDIPYYVFTHGMLDPWFKRKYPLKHVKKWLFWPWTDYRVLRDARGVIFTCEEERLRARKSFSLYKVQEAVTALGIASPPDNGNVLANKFISTYPQLKDKRIVLFLGRIHEKKGCDLLLEAFAEVAKYDETLQLVMAGPDQTGWASSLKVQAEKLNIAERITWTGMIQGNLKWGGFYAAEVFCLPSHQENFGIVVAEALACGTPVLISNKVNIWREVEADKAGFVDDDTVEGAIRNLGRWLSLEPDDYRKMSERSRCCFFQRFHIRRAAERLIEIIGENTSEKTRIA